METLSPQEDTVGANPSSVKSDDSSPRADSGRGSPPPNCAICLGTCKNKSFTDSCLHQFCFSCLLTWSKVKAECPLCKQVFKSIIHNVRSNHQYEEYMVEQRHTEETIDMDSLASYSNALSNRRFRYRTTLTFPRRQSMAIERLLLHYPLIGSAVPPPAHGLSEPRPQRRSPDAFRRTVYRHNLWARPLPDYTGRFRDCTPEFYRYNDAQMHRLVPWLNRELRYLLNENLPHITYVMDRILELLPLHHITSPEFREAMHYFGERTEHFLHELHCFASTPYDLTGYDRHVQYTTDPRISTMVNEISSTDSDGSVDSDIVMVSSSQPAALPLLVPPTAGPSHPLHPLHSHQPAPPPQYLPANNVIPIETISHSDTDDGSEVMVVGYIKPPQDRTPEVVDLLGSDSDVVVQDAPAPGPGPGAGPGPSQAAEPQESATNVPLVKLSLKRHHTAFSEDSDSDVNYVRPPHTKTRVRRRRSNDSATTANTWRGTPSPPASDCSWHVGDAPSASTNSKSPSTATASASSSTSNVRRSLWSSNSSSSTSTDSDSSYCSRHRKSRKKSKRKITTKTVIDEETKKRSKSKKSRKEKKNQATQTQRKERSKDKKSHSGKDVKSSKKKEETSTEQPEASQDQPGTSGVSNKLKRKDKSKSDRDRERSRRERKKLKSVVKVMKKQQSSETSGISLLNIVGSAILNPNSNVLTYNSDSGSIPGDERINKVPSELLEKAESCFNLELLPVKTKRQADNSDSEDDLPLNLTMNRT